MAMKVLLVNTNRMKPPIAPIGLDYLSDCLRASGHVTRLLDLCFCGDVEDAIASSVRAFGPDTVGVSVRNTDDCYFASGESFLPGIKSVVESLRRASHAPIVMGGVGFSVMPEAAMDFFGADYGIAGEGEVAFPRLLGAMDSKAGFDAVPGLLFRRRGELCGNPASDVPLHALPSRSRSFVDNRRYFREGGQAGFETKRGCPMGCIYCVDPVSKGRRTRVRSPREVAAELAELLSLGIDHFHTCDPEFNIPREHAEEVCRALIDARLSDRIRWYAYCSIRPFDAEIARLFRAAGCAGIDFGADSGSDEILAALGRDFRAEDLPRTAGYCRSAGIPFMFDLLLGGPGETMETMRRTIDAMRRIDPDCVGISAGVRVYGNTPLARQVQAQGRMEDNPALQGEKRNNPDFLKPVFYVSPGLGDGILDSIRELVGNDERFFLPSRREEQSNYNYNDNTVLSRAIESGGRGAYWDILRKLRKK